ncbi:MAG TPA: TNT domain-containing protein [Amycolatopsis sp.]|uniref:TNT domain-containing protein n=1 Tax=Amycolatopsis sp. TaxID=37632 RepID=UPI002B49A077|nr:TNT domain-containing protein [Amycolatopsis sp.]HJQ45758.1 TNT domain-containing protein [Amycolatopsis sp.]HKS46080.1 TNT domain-containing protein [Amycolatopsis sp.]
MGIELPKELADVAAATGLSWPQADEDKLREQANAWRDAQTKLTNLASEADHTAAGAVGAMSGDAAEAAGKLWSGYVHPDHGKLTQAATGAGAAADRLEHAADQVGAAKVEMVRQLVSAAKNRDAARTAASSGHPTALLGLDTVLRGTATNLSALTHGLADAVGPGGGPVAATPLVDPHPGAHTPHGQAGLLSTVTGLPGYVLSTGDAVVSPVVDRVVDNSVDKVVAPVTGHAASVTHHVTSTVADVAGTTGPVAHVAESTLDTPRQLPRQHLPPPQVPQPVPAAPAPDAGTGPIRIPHPAPAPAAGQYGGLLDHGGFDDVATPPSGLPAPQHAQRGVPGGTIASGFADAASAPPPPGAGFVPGAAPANPQPGYSPGYAAPPPVTGGPPVPGGSVAPPPHAGAVPGGAVTPGTPVAGRGPSFAPRPQVATGFRYTPQIEPQPYAAPRPEPARPEPPRPVPPVGVPRRERESIVALFLVHMFPIGHLPVPAERPARQLPVPPQEVDYAPGLRFPPHDHPDSALIDSSDALEKVRAGLSRLPTLPTSPPPALTEGYDPLGGLHERDWDRRFLVGLRDSVPEYAWPPGEVYPEGGSAEGQPELLPEGTTLDRFGDITGRVFAPEGTPFAHRSLPASALDAGYRRYRVLREVPMWRAVSAGWFGQPGSGVRYRAIYSADELVSMGYLADVTFEEGQ